MSTSGDFSVSNIHNFTFTKVQQKNYKNLQHTLIQLGIPLVEIRSKTITEDKTGRKKISFKAKSEDSGKICIEWYKYEAPSIGSGQNWITLISNNRRERYKLSEWLNMDIEYLKKLISS